MVVAQKIRCRDSSPTGNQCIKRAHHTSPADQHPELHHYHLEPKFIIKDGKILGTIRERIDEWWAVDPHQSGDTERRAGPHDRRSTPHTDIQIDPSDPASDPATDADMLCPFCSVPLRDNQDNQDNRDNQDNQHTHSADFLPMDART
jgi:hypothetical protein